MRGPHIEFKEGLNYPEVRKYVIACLNSRIQGRIYLGIEDTQREIVGVEVQEGGKDRIRRHINGVLRDIQPDIPTGSVTTFYPVLDSKKESLKNQYIIEVTVPAADSQVKGFYYNKHDEKAFERRGSENAEISVKTAQNRLARGQMSRGEQEITTKQDNDLEPGRTTNINITVNVLPNPYNIAAPATKEMFKGRDTEINTLLNAIWNGQHLSIHGLKRVGKTSLVEETLLDKINNDDKLRDKILFAKVDLHEEGGRNITIGNLLNAIIKGIANEIPGRDLAQIDAVLGRSYTNSNLQSMLSDYTRYLEGVANQVTSGENQRIVLFLDEFSELYRAIKTSRHQNSPGTRAEDIHADVRLIQWLSALMRNRNLTRKLVFILAVRPFVVDIDKDPDINLLRLTLTMNLSYLDKPAATKLMTEPVADDIDYDADAIDYLYHLTTGHPYLIQLMLSRILNRIENRNCITKQDIEDEEEILSLDRNAGPNFDVLESDYSMDVVDNRITENHGKRVLASIARKCDNSPEGWVGDKDLCEQLKQPDFKEDQIYDLLAQLRDANIIDEDENDEGGLKFRMSIPLLQKRYIKQNMYGRYVLGQGGRK